MDNLERDQGIIQMREGGYSLAEIGKKYSLTRQRVNQILGPTGLIEKKPKIFADLDKNKSEVWLEASQSLEWWGKGGKLKQAKIVERFLRCGYTWAESRRLAKVVQGSKLDVVLSVSFNVEPNILAQTSFFSTIAADMAKYDILAHINSRQPLQVSKRLFDRRWSDLGLRAKKIAKSNG